MGVFLFRLDVSTARSGAGRRQLASDVVGPLGKHTAIPGELAATPAARSLLEARIGMRRLRSDPMPGLRRRWLDRRLHERNPPPARISQSASQGPDRAVGTRLSALCFSRAADRIPPGNAALVGLLAQGHRYRRDGRTDVAR